MQEGVIKYGRIEGGTSGGNKRMRTKDITFTEEEKTAIQAELKNVQPPHVYKRLMAIKMKAIDGKSSREIGEVVGLHATSVNRIVQRMKAEGMEAIVTKRHHHGNRYMSQEEEIVFLKSFQEKGEAGQIIEVTDIHKAYERAVGHAVTRNAIYYLLHKHQWRKVMPRSKHPKKASEAEIQAYQKNLGGTPKGSAGSPKSAGDVSGRGWLWTDQ